MYIATVRFREIADSDHVYEVDDVFPREGYEPTYERVQSLSTDKNKVGYPVITEIPDSDDDPPVDPEKDPPVDPEKDPPVDPEKDPPVDPEKDPPADPEKDPPADPEKDPPADPEPKEDKPKRGSAAK